MTRCATLGARKDGERADLSPFSPSPFSPSPRVVRFWLVQVAHGLNGYSSRCSIESGVCRRGYETKNTDASIAMDNRNPSWLSLVRSGDCRCRSPQIRLKWKVDGSTTDAKLPIWICCDRFPSDCTSNNPLPGCTASIREWNWFG